MRTTLTRRAVLALTAAAAAAAPGLPALAQPARTLKLIVPFPAGGTADILPRLLADKVRAAILSGSHPRAAYLSHGKF